MTKEPLDPKAQRLIYSAYYLMLVSPLLGVWLISLMPSLVLGVVAVFTLGCIYGVMLLLAESDRVSSRFWIAVMLWLIYVPAATWMFMLFAGVASFRWGL